MKIFLFDMDGVLLESHGYHLALQETVRRMAGALGVGDVTLSPDDIAAFESGGITSEWDEAAICTALLLETVWLSYPDRRLPDSLAENATIASVRPAPDFNALACRLSALDLLSLLPLERAERYFMSTGHFIQAQSNILLELIRGARDPQRSLTHRTFQELVLGSAKFSRTYKFPPTLDCESYLLKHDLSNLPQTEIARLKDWLSASGHAAAVITSRPSHSSVGAFSTPEAELGTTLVGLDDMPVAGWGGIIWLGLQRHSAPENFIKPSPVHALAALRLSLGEAQDIAFTDAANLVETGRAGLAWQRLEGAQVFVFEDSPNGIKSLQAARQVLDKAEIHIETNYIGIARNPIKTQALMANNAQVFPSLTEALSLSME